MTTLPPHCAVVMKSRNLNFLEPSGPLQTCKGTDLSQHEGKSNKSFEKIKSSDIWEEP